MVELCLIISLQFIGYFSLLHQINQNERVIPPSLSAVIFTVKSTLYRIGLKLMLEWNCSYSQRGNDVI